MNIFITGANRGIGLELTKQCLEAGHSVIATARDPDAATHLHDLTTQFGSKLTIMKLDVSSDDSVRAFREALDPQTTIDLLINNAGVYVDSDSKLRTLEIMELEETFQTNTLGPIRVTKALEHALIRSDAPKVATLTSIMGSISDNTLGGSYAYRMSKTAINMFIKNLSIEHKDWVVLGLHPGWVRTEMGGAGASVPPETSARGLLEVIHTATRAQSGHFIDYRGKNWDT
jgi:NAD(P)-dependent dehydrogenase (short-subunit alcohol dehydrogenase family)